MKMGLILKITRFDCGDPKLNGTPFCACMDMRLPLDKVEGGRVKTLAGKTGTLFWPVICKLYASTVMGGVSGVCCPCSARGGTLFTVDVPSLSLF